MENATGGAAEASARLASLASRKGASWDALRVCPGQLAGWLAEAAEAHPWAVLACVDAARARELQDASGARVSALRRALRQQSEGSWVGRTPTALVILDAHALGHAMAGEALATGADLLLVLDRDPDPRSFLDGRRTPREAHAAGPARIFRPPAGALAVFDAGGTVSIACVEGHPELGLRKGDRFTRCGR